MKLTLILACISFLVSCNFHAANVKINFIVKSINTPDTARIYITGNHGELGDWTPDKVELSYHNDQKWKITLAFKINTKLAFKFTRGSWDKEALLTEGGVPANHTLIVKKDTTIEFHIEKWKDSYMNLNSRKITGDFEFHHKIEYEGLKPRDVIVWLPPDYSTEIEKKYPVLYMKDGQNLFDPNTSFQGIDWQIDETADHMIKKK